MSRRPRRAARTATALLAAVALSQTALGCAKNETTTTATTAAGSGTGAAFSLGKDAGAAIKAAGLPAMSSEGSVAHYHAHLDVIVNGSPVTVPANIGIDASSRTISPLHTHTADGIVHIEAEQDANFTVGQLLVEWGVKLDKNCLATYCTDDKNQLLAFKNGKPEADPGGIVLKSHDEVVLWYGPKGTTPTVPASFEFEGGL